MRRSQAEKNASHKHTVCNMQDLLYSSPEANPKNFLGTKGHLSFLSLFLGNKFQTCSRYLNFLYGDIYGTWYLVGSDIYNFFFRLSCMCETVSWKMFHLAWMTDCLFWFKIMMMLMPCIIGIAKRMWVTKLIMVCWLVTVATET